LVAAAPRLRAFALRLSHDAVLADDLVQETLLKAWLCFSRFEPQSNLDAWLCSILRHVFYSGLRKYSREVPDIDGVHAATLVVEPGHVAALAYHDFQKAFDKLSTEHQEVLMLVGFSGLRCEQAAAILGISVGAVKSRTSRARFHLARLLQLENDEGIW
jgi:RNA polymerase sigma-70 factor (ECF subfamily)